MVLLRMHGGTTSEGETFDTFLGKGTFEEVMSRYDEFLHESFGRGPIAFNV
jgi:hypothetical protein